MSQSLGKQNLPYIITEVSETLTFDTANAITLATNQDDIVYTIDVTGKNYKYYDFENDSYSNYTGLVLSTNGWLAFRNTGEYALGTNNQLPLKTLRFFSFDASTTMKYYFDSNNNCIISSVGNYYNSTDIVFNIITKVTPKGVIYVNYINIGPTILLFNKPTIGWVGENSSLRTDDVFYSTFDGVQPFNQSNINGKTLQFNFSDSIIIGDSPNIYPICFPSGTPVETDQGNIEIQKIKPSIHTIRGNKIVAITKTVTIEDKIVCIEKDALGTNIPSQKTFISRSHKLLYNKQMVKAKDLICQVEGVYNKKYNGEILYNVLLETYEKMIVNNLIVETLDPENIVALLYNGSCNEEEKNNIIVNVNNCAKDYKKVYGKLR